MNTDFGFVDEVVVDRYASLLEGKARDAAKKAASKAARKAAKTMARAEVVRASDVERDEFAELVMRGVRIPVGFEL